MTENYQHNKPPTFDDENETVAEIDPTPDASTPPTTNTAPAPSPTNTTTAPTAPAVQTGRALPNDAGKPVAPSNRAVIVPATQAAPRQITDGIKDRGGVWTPADRSLVRAPHWVILGFIAVLAFALRLREPLSSPIMGAEDPYTHMFRTWDLVQGNFPRDYPVGFRLLLAPFTLLGPDVFYTVARFLPTLSGPGMVVAMFFFCRNYMVPAGALTASFMMGVMPEVIFRSNLLFPTTLDLAIAPVLLLSFFRMIEGQRWAMYSVIGITLGLLLTHPWFVALMLPPMAIFGVVVLVTHRERRTWAASGSIAGAMGLVGLVVLFRKFQASDALMGHAVPKFFEVMGNPGYVVSHVPRYVDLPNMLTWPALLLALVGAVFAVIRRSRIGLLALLWTFLMLPLTLVDWFGEDLWYLPHRTVAYLAVGVALLCGIAVAEIIHSFTRTNNTLRLPATLGALGLIALLTLPSAVAVDPWYRIFTEDDFAAYDALEAQGAPYVMCGSWQARAGYRALTAGEADYMPDFFDNENQRAVVLQTHPGMFVLVDNATIADGRGTSWLSGGDWQLAGEWGVVQIYRHVD